MMMIMLKGSPFGEQGVLSPFASELSRITDRPRVGEDASNPKTFRTRSNIPQTWKLEKIVPILKPDKDPGQGTSYRPISLLSPIAKTLEKIILPHITQNIPNQEH